MKPSLSNCTDQAPILMEFQSNLPLQWGSRKRFRPVSAISSIPLQNLSLAINGSESDGDELEGGNFPLNFKEYRFKENLKCSRNELKILGVTRFVWVFWSQPPLPSLDKCADLYPEVRDKIRDALEKLILWTDFAECLVQFWAPASTLVEPTFLRTQDQPFAFGRANKHLCEYRVNIREDKFYVDADSKEEQLGLPGRVFRHKFPECNPNVKNYSIKEYPQRDLALRCKIMGSWAVPVFEHQTCVGVLEMVSRGTGSWFDRSFLDRMDNIFKEFGLQCCDRCPNSEMHLSCEPSKYPYVNILSRQEKGLIAAFEELNRVLRSVCETHELPLAMIWVPCSACDSLQPGLFWSKDGFERGYSSFHAFFGICHLRQGQVAQRALLSRKMLYCSDITQLSVDECPLVPYARQRKLNGWFTICLQSRETGNDIYVLEFFFSDESKDDKIIRTRLSFILGTMDEKFETFKLASGKELGEKMSIEGIYFRNDKVDYSVKSFQAIRNISGSSSVQSSPSVDSPSYSVQLLKVTRESSTSDANTRSRSQDADMVTIRAKLERAVYCIKFKLSLPCRLVELQQKVAERLKLDTETYHIYHIDKGEWIWITCDQELQTWVHNRGIP